MTSWQAGMAVPDWPLSFGSINPEGWWTDFPVRLEHGHRLFAVGVAALTSVLTASVWRNWYSLVWAFLAAVLAWGIGKIFGAPPPVLAHLGVWPAAMSFLVALRLKGKGTMRGAGEEVDGAAGERSLAISAFCLVCVQATLGGLRVTQETAGAVHIAVYLKIFHACVAQTFLVVLVMLSARIGRRLRHLNSDQGGVGDSRLRTGAWLCLFVVFVQLVLGATMRHLGAGLAIPTFPLANPHGGFFPNNHGMLTDLNFAHTRIGAILVSLTVLISCWRILSASGIDRFAKIHALQSVCLVFVQVTVGVLVVWHLKPPTLTTFHVLVGAMLLASLAAGVAHLSMGRPGKISGGAL